MRLILLSIFFLVAVAPLSGQDIFCPMLRVEGKVIEPNRKAILRFSAKEMGSPVTGHRWIVLGGKIVKGQGTATILVRIDRRLRIDVGDTVTATVWVRGLPEGGDCPDHAAFTTVLASLPREL